MRARVEVTVDGQPMAGAFYERLISLSVTDKEGVSSDTFQAELNDGPPAFLALPRTGAIVDIKLGYAETGMRSVGRFTVDKVSAKCLPYSLSISGKSADLRNGKLKENKERHWDGKTVGEVVQEIAGECDLSASVDDEVGSHKYEWLGQQDEQNILFLERLARRHNALMTIKDGRLIFSKRGSGLSSGGTFVGSVIVSPRSSCRVLARSRSTTGPNTRRWWPTIRTRARPSGWRSTPTPMPMATASIGSTSHMQIWPKRTKRPRPRPCN